MLWQADGVVRRTCGGREGRRDEQALGEDADEVVGAAAVEEKHVVVDLAALQSLLLAVALHAEQRLHLARCSTSRTHTINVHVHVQFTIRQQG